MDGTESVDDARNAPASRDVRALVVGGNASFRFEVASFLDEHGFATVTAPLTKGELSAAWAESTDLVIADLQGSGGSAPALVRGVRSVSTASIILVTDVETDGDRCLAHLDPDVDDFVSRPFGLRELLARSRAALRRKRASGQHSGRLRRWCSFQGSTLDRRDRILLSPTGTNVALTNNEYSLLSAFVSAPRQPLSRERLLQATRLHEDVKDRSVDIQVLRLRRKLALAGCGSKLIATVRLLGYVFNADVETS